MTNAMTRRARELAAAGPVARACGFMVDRDADTVSLQVSLAEIPAPPFQETLRGHFVRDLFADAGCRSVSVDAVGNVVGWLGPEGPAALVVSAHLDTVFPQGTDVSVTRSNGRLIGPGISDDARGLAALVALARAISVSDVPLARPLLLVATVGEEGAGNLRGVRHLFGPSGAAHDASAFISLDGAGLSRIVTRGLGVRRLRAVVRGAGGHSWVDWGVPNPVHALGTAVERITKVPSRTGPAATATVARWGGGTSINAIPAEGWIELDLRSEVAGLLARTEAAVRTALETAVADINAAATNGYEPLTLSIEVIGARPAGATRAKEPLVQAAVAATREVGVEAQLVASSTDANVPMSLGVPAVTLGAGGEAGRAHTADEWYENRSGARGLVRAMLTTMLVVGLAED